MDRQRILEHYVCGHRDQSLEATRLFDLAAIKFESALQFSYDDESVLNRYRCDPLFCLHLAASRRISPPPPPFTTLLQLCPCSWPQFHCRYAETLCQHAGYGASTSSAEDVAASLSDYNQKVRKAIAMFRRTENCDGVRSLMGKLPPDDTYADLLCEAFRAIEDMDPSYFNDYVDFLAPLPAQFSLGKCEGGKVLPHLIVC